MIATSPRVRPALVILALAAAACTSPGNGQKTEDALTQLRTTAALPACPLGVGSDLPNLTLPCLSGGADVKLRARSSGRPTLVNIWATWCPPCVREVPLLVRFAKAAQGQVTVLGVLTEDDPKLALKFAVEFHMTYSSVIDDQGRVLRKYSAGPPVTLFVDASGKVRFIKRGEINSEGELRKLARTYLQVTVDEPA